MELKDFVSETLLTIIQGVHDAQASSEEFGAQINPSGRYNLEPQNIEFDLAVTVFEGDQKQAGIKANLLQVIGSNLKTQTNYDLTSVQHIKFSVPVLLPSQETERG